MLTFADKGITQDIVYNFLNLPKQIKQNSNTTTYSYRADGVKLRKQYVINSENIFTEYLDGFVYTSPYTAKAREALEADNDETREAVTAGQEEAISMEEKVIKPGDPQTEYIVNLSFFPTAEGFYDYENSKYIYQYKDHLGNVRLSYSKNSSTGVLEKLDKNDYYPFGLNFINTRIATETSFSPATTYKNWKYNGKELQETGMYDYGARFYMPDIARWGVVDPLAETSRRWNPYTYAFNNPVRFIDPDGMEAEESGGGGDTSGGSNDDMATGVDGDISLAFGVRASELQNSGAAMTVINYGDSTGTKKDTSKKSQKDPTTTVTARISHTYYQSERKSGKLNVGTDVIKLEYDAITRVNKRVTSEAHMTLVATVGPDGSYNQYAVGSVATNNNISSYQIDLKNPLTDYEAKFAAYVLGVSAYKANMNQTPLMVISEANRSFNKGMDQKKSIVDNINFGISLIPDQRIKAINYCLKGAGYVLDVYGSTLQGKPEHPDEVTFRQKIK